jgi:hypothetical protein
MDQSGARGIVASRRDGESAVAIGDEPREDNAPRSDGPAPASDREPEGQGAVGEAAPGAAPPPRRLRLATLVVLATALIALVPTVGDLGMTWDEPAYRYSQVISAQWWEQWPRVRSWEDVRALLDPTTLLYYWPYGRYGINFHPPLAGQLNLATYAIFGHWMKDIPARRMATVIEFALTLVIGFRFLARRYGIATGVAMAGSLLLMPRLYGQAHLIDTDIPALLLWAATALAFWKGLHEPDARRWRVLVGILVGLGFVEKMAAVMVLLPLIGWLIAGRLIPAAWRPMRGAWVDGVVTTAAMLAPLGLAFQQVQMIQRQLLPADKADLFKPVPSDWPGAILAIPMAIWVVRRVLGRLFRGSKVWGVERPALETWTAILAFAPVIAWLGNPAWWRETLPRLAHYYMLTTDRSGVLPSIQILYFGQLYTYSLPWHNAFVLTAITVPVAILVAAAVGLVWGLLRIRRDRLPLYFLVHLLALPVVRMFPTPAHDGVRLFLPTFFFLAAFAAWGANRLAEILAKVIRRPGSLPWIQAAMAGAVLGPSAVALYRIHPYELSYYNELIGGPRGAWERGFELSYWYDAFNNRVIEDLNQLLPRNAQIDFLNENTKSAVPVFQDQQNLGILRGDIVLVRTALPFPYVWLLTHDSKAAPFTRLLFGMRPWYASEPPQLGGARVASVYDPVAVSRAWALYLLLDAPDPSLPDPPAAPKWVHRRVPWLARFWGDDLRAGFDNRGRWRARVRRPAVNPAILEKSRSDPEWLLTAARLLADKRPLDQNPGEKRLYALVTGEGTDHDPVREDLTNQLLVARPEALVDAVRILNAHRDEVVRIMTRYAYTDPLGLGGYLDRDLGAEGSSH